MIYWPISNRHFAAKLRNESRETEMLDRPSAWVGRSARQIARAVRRGDTSATAVVADHLDQIRQYDRILGAFRQNAGDFSG